MIYNQNEYGKEKKQSYIEEHESRRSLIWHGLVVAMFTFAMHFILQTLTRSVLISIIPEVMMPSYFSVLSLYVILAFLMYSAYIAKYFNYLTYAEISQNRWYTLVKSGYHPIKLIIVKLMTRVLEVFTFYTIGFIITVLLTLFLKYPFISSYFLPLYVVGLIDILFVTIVTMGCSLFIADQKNARYIIMIAAISIWVLRLSSGFYDMVSDREWMRNSSVIQDLFQTHYVLYFILSVLLCIILIVVRARQIARYTNFPFYKKDMDIEDNIQIVVVEGDSFTPIKEQKYMKKKRNKMLDRCVNLTFIGVISIGIMINVFVLFVSLSSPERETNFFGVIPFVFHTESMQPEIMYNDLAFFESRATDTTCEIGDIVLYRDAFEPVVSKVVDSKGDKLVVDILNYQEGVSEGRYEKTIEEDSVYGIYSGRNRWLGMLILFANTVVGRLLLLLVPVAMIYYYNPLIAYLKKKGYMLD